MKIRYAKKTDIEILLQYDKWIRNVELKRKIEAQQVYDLEKNSNFIGWMRWGLFWDNVPFLYMLHILSEYQNQGYGKKSMFFWENEMRLQGYKFVLVSTASSESAQYFYRKLGYKEIGSFIIKSEPLEMIFIKDLQ